MLFFNKLEFCAKTENFKTQTMSRQFSFKDSNLSFRTRLFIFIPLSVKKELEKSNNLQKSKPKLLLTEMLIISSKIFILDVSK